MKDEIKSKLSTYVVGGIAGAVVVLIAGFWIGPLTTNGALADAVDVAIVEQQALFCAERGRADPTYVNGATFTELELAAKRDFATRFATFDGQDTAAGRSVATACREILEEV